MFVHLQPGSQFKHGLPALTQVQPLVVHVDPLLHEQHGGWYASCAVFRRLDPTCGWYVTISRDSVSSDRRFDGLDRAESSAEAD